LSPGARIASFGSAGVLVIAGAACAALLSGVAGQILAMVLVGLGLILATALVFLEVGLSEDRERARAAPRQIGRRPPPSRRLKPAHLGRSRGQRRRLG
jgi:hypothetical protein